MAKPTKNYFKISSALKNVIGKDLITDDFVAIFELVKNSFDANATKVELTFKNTLTENCSITIQDNGKGMDLYDLEHKWLFVAYSAKKEGVEDYRDKIKSTRIHAGAKGIGRFSCDRLGQKLTIYTRKNQADEFCKLSIDWQKFELDMQKEFANIPVDIELTNTCPYDLSVGTVICIRDSRSRWDVDRLRTLRRSLEKLINPGQENSDTPFSVYLHAEEYESVDRKVRESGNKYDVVNGKIENFLFENLELKTTSIDVEIDHDGTTIKTELFDRGLFVYRMVEENTYKYSGESLKNLRVKLFHLNQSGKAFFTKYMGIRAVNFGSVFVYKNGFRIHPIGEIGRGDVFNIDARKQQGTSRFFGTRDLIGRIEINGENIGFQEASSRDGGLERNEAFHTLKTFFMESCLKRLERYAIDVIKFGNIDQFNVNDIDDDFPKEKALAFIEALTKSPTIYDVEFNSDLFDVVSNSSEKSLNSLLSNLTKISKDSNNPQLMGEIESINRRLNEFSKAKSDAETESRKEKERRKEAERLAKVAADKARAAQEEADKQRLEAEKITKESVFLRSLVSSDLQNVVSLHHHIGIAAGTIQNYVRSTTKKIRDGKPITAERFLAVLDEISFVASQISATTKFATKANFNLDAELIEADLFGYVEEYLLNVCSGLIKVEHDVNTDLIFEWTNPSSLQFVTKFRPLEVSMVLDGLISNAVKSGAKKMVVKVEETAVDFLLRFSNDGRPIKSANLSKIFDMGFTTTNGSGLGLHHARSIVERMKGKITAVEDLTDSAEFIISLSRGT